MAAAAGGYPQPGLIERDLLKQIAEPPAVRIKRVREKGGDETAGTTSQGAQVWRQDELFHKPTHNEQTGQGLDGQQNSGTQQGHSAAKRRYEDIPQADGVADEFERQQKQQRREEDGASMEDSPLLSIRGRVEDNADIASTSSSSTGSSGDDESDHMLRDGSHTERHSGLILSSDSSTRSIQGSSPPLSSPPSSPPDTLSTALRLQALASNINGSNTAASARTRKLVPQSIRQAVNEHPRATPTRSRSVPGLTYLVPLPVITANPSSSLASSPCYPLFNACTTGQTSTSSSPSSSSTSSGSSSSGSDDNPSPDPSCRSSPRSNNTHNNNNTNNGDNFNPPSPPPPDKKQHTPFWAFPESTPFAQRVDKSSMCNALSFLPTRSVLAARGVCRLWCDYTYQPIVWSFGSSLEVRDVAVYNNIHWPSVSMLRQLELTRCERLTDDALARITVCASLQLLDLSYCSSLTNAALVHVATLHSLQILSIESCAQLTDNALSHLPALPQLHSLSLSFCPFTDYGLQYLSHCTSLEFLQLCYVQQISGRGLQALIPLPKLINLNLGHSSLKDNDLAPLRSLTHLNALNLESMEVTDASLSNLATLDSLTSLNLHEIHNLSDKTLELLSSHCTRLSSLYFSYTDLVTDSGVGHLTRLAPTLRVLEMPECEQITDESCRHISKMSQLATLDLTGCYRITDEGIQQLAGLHNLTLLNLGMLRSLTDEACDAISHLPRLLSLELNSCSQLSAQSAQSIARICTLRSLSVSEVAGWDDTAVAHLLQLEELDALCLSGTGITVLSLRRLLSMRYLKELNVYSCPNVTEEDLQAVKEEAHGRVAINV